MASLAGNEAGKLPFNAVFNHIYPNVALFFCIFIIAYTFLAHSVKFSYWHGLYSEKYTLHPDDLSQLDGIWMIF